MEFDAAMADAKRIQHTARIKPEVQPATTTRARLMWPPAEVLSKAQRMTAVLSTMQEKGRQYWPQSAEAPGTSPFAFVTAVLRGSPLSPPPRQALPEGRGAGRMAATPLRTQPGHPLAATRLRTPPGHPWHALVNEAATRPRGPGAASCSAMMV
eukprot:2699789-Prymnesium_polylepis.1